MKNAVTAAEQRPGQPKLWGKIRGQKSDFGGQESEVQNWKPETWLRTEIAASRVESQKADGLITPDFALEARQ